MKKNSYTLLVVDDDADAVKIIVHYIQRLRYVAYLGIEEDGEKAMHRLEEESVDILILDIDLDKIQGFDILKFLSDPPVTIICSVHGQYAYDAFDFKGVVVDYIPKFVPFERFEEAIQKAIARVDDKMPEWSQDATELIVPKWGAKGKIAIPVATMIHAEIMDKKMIFHGLYDTYEGRISMRDLEKLLSPDNFLRVHKSHMVQIAYMESYGSNKLFMKSLDIPVPVGDTFRDKVKEALLRR